MSKIRETVAKAAGKVKKAGSILSGDKGILRDLKEEHGEVDALMKQVQMGDVSTRRDLFPKIRSELLSHAHAEQAVFYTVLRNYGQTQSLTAECLREHREIEELIGRLDTMPIDSVGWKERFAELAKLVESHVEREENDLFPLAKQALDEEQLEEMERRFSEQKSRELERLEQMSMARPGRGTTGHHIPPQL